jgi:hypothetical protein
VLPQDPYPGRSSFVSGAASGTAGCSVLCALALSCVGLGLAIARGIIRAHGGDILLANRPRGLRALLRLPRAG